MTGRRALLTLVGSMTAAGALIFGAAELPLPPWGRPGELWSWWRTNDPAVCTFAVLRLIGLVLSLYLGLLGLTGWAMATTRWRPAERLFTVVATPGARRVIMGGGLAATLSVPSIVSAELDPAPRVVDLGAASQFSIADIGPASAPGDGPPPDLEPVTDPEATDVSRPDPEPVIRSSPVEATPAPAVPDPIDPPALRGPDQPASAPSAIDDVWTVAAGDHLWSIAEETLADHGLETTEAPVAAYWLRLIEANRDTVGDNPDLIHPGQRIRLPDVG